MLNATRAVTDRLEALADLLREKTVDTTPYEALLRENVARLKETKGIYARVSPAKNLGILPSMAGIARPLGNVESYGDACFLQVYCCSSYCPSLSGGGTMTSAEMK